MRHLEIMAAGCIPFFTDLDKLPSLTMQFYPKGLQQEAKVLEGVTFSGPHDDPASFNVDRSKVDFDKYYDLATQILEHSRKHLTTRAMAQYVLNTVGNPSPRRALIATSCVDDYLQDSMLHGLKRALGKRLTDIVPEARELPAEHCVNDISNAHTPLPDYRLKHVHGLLDRSFEVQLAA